MSLPSCNNNDLKTQCDKMTNTNNKLNKPTLIENHMRSSTFFIIEKKKNQH